MAIKRNIVFYDKKTDKYLGEIPINIELEKLKQIFKPKKKDPLLYDPYKIGTKQKTALEKFGSVNLDLSAFDYFLECYQE